MPVETKSVFRFADLEVHELELRATRGGQALDIEPKAFRVLVYLIKHAGHLVSKSELMDAVWGETAVTDNSLTRAIALLRRVLEDDPHQPLFIETVSTAGYRFICPVVNVGPESSRAAEVATNTGAAGHIPEVTEAKAESRSWLRKSRWDVIVGVSVVVIAAAAVLWYARQPLPPPHISEVVRITNDPRYLYKRLGGTDGRRVYFNPGSNGGPGIGQVPVSGGDISLIPAKGWVAAVSPDGMSLLVLGDRNPKDQMYDIYVVGASGGPTRLLTSGWDVAWSGDAKQVIYTTPKREIFAIPSAGGKPRLIRQLEGLEYMYNLAYSPDGSKIRFNWGSHRIMEMSPDGSNLHEILAGWHPTDYKSCGFWAPDGSFFVFFSAATAEVSGFPAPQMWALDERRGWLRKAAEPVQLTFGPMTWLMPGTFTPDGRKIMGDGQTWRGELVRYNRHTKQLEPFLGGISADMLDFSRDGKSVLYTPFPGGILLRANRDGTGVQQVISVADFVSNPRWSPDGSQIAFEQDSDGQTSLTYVVGSQGGNPVRVLSGDKSCCNEVDPTWSPDGKRLALWVESPEGKTDTELRMVDVSTHEVSHFPRPPKRTWSPRWSPDGRYIVCLTNPYPDTDGLEVYDFKTNEWKIVLTETGSGGWPSWSHDSRWIYYVGSNRGQGDRFTIFRISVDGGKPEQIADLTGFRGTGHE